MRAITAAATAAITGGTLTIAYGAIEVTAAAAGAAIPDGIRTWAATLIGLTTLGPLGLAILCRQRAILERLGLLTDLLLTDERTQARREYDSIRRQIDDGDDGGTLHYIRPKE